MSDYIINKLRKEVDRHKNAGGMQAGLPTVKVDLYELERLLDRINQLEAERDAPTTENIIKGWWYCSECRRSWHRRKDEDCPFCERDALKVALDRSHFKLGWRTPPPPENTDKN